MGIAGSRRVSKGLIRSLVKRGSKDVRRLGRAREEAQCSTCLTREGGTWAHDRRASIAATSGAVLTLTRCHYWKRSSRSAGC
jgi:hypothetical protein